MTKLNFMVVFSATLTLTLNLAFAIDYPQSRSSANGAQIPATEGTAYNLSDLSFDKIKIQVRGFCSCQSIIGEDHNCGVNQATTFPDSTGRFLVPAFQIPVDDGLCGSTSTFSTEAFVITQGTLAGKDEEHDLFAGDLSSHLNVTILQIDPVATRLVLPSGQDAQGWMTASLSDSTLNGNVNVWGLDAAGKPQGMYVFGRDLQTTTSSVVISGVIMAFPTTPDSLPNAQLSFALWTTTSTELYKLKQTVPYSRSMLNQFAVVALDTASLDSSYLNVDSKPGKIVIQSQGPSANGAQAIADVVLSLRCSNHMLTGTLNVQFGSGLSEYPPQTQSLQGTCDDLGRGEFTTVLTVGTYDGGKTLPPESVHFVITGSGRYETLATLSDINSGQEIGNMTVINNPSVSY